MPDDVPVPPDPDSEPPPAGGDGPRGADGVTPTVWTVGHSDHPAEALVGLLRTHGIDVVADVRSVPWSRRFPHHSRPALERTLADAGIRYVFCGDRLGARPTDPACYEDGRVSYRRLAATPAFAEGVARITAGAAAGRRIALLCAERDPLDCHRTILVAPALEAAGCEVVHILADGTTETHRAALERLAGPPTLFDDPAGRLAAALEARAARLAWSPPADDPHGPAAPGTGGPRRAARPRRRGPR